jgi:hypothetical protein
LGLSIISLLSCKSESSYVLDTSPCLEIIRKYFFLFRGLFPQLFSTSIIAGRHGAGEVAESSTSRSADSRKREREILGLVHLKPQAPSPPPPPPSDTLPPTRPNLHIVSFPEPSIFKYRDYHSLYILLQIICTNMFTAALFITASKTLEQSRCTSTDEKNIICLLQKQNKPNKIA